MRAERLILIAKDYIWFEENATRYLKKYKRENVEAPLYRIVGNYYTDFDIAHEDIARLYKLDNNIQCLDINGNVLNMDAKIAGFFLAFIWSMFDTMVDIYQIDLYKKCKERKLWEKGIKSINPYSGEVIKANVVPYLYMFYCEENGIKYIEPKEQMLHVERYKKDQERKKKCIDKIEYYKTNALNIENQYCSIYEELANIDIALKENVNISVLENMVRCIERKIERIELKRNINSERMKQETDIIWKMIDMAMGDLAQSRMNYKFSNTYRQSASTNKADTKGNYQATSLLTPTEQKFYNLLLLECMKINMNVYPKVRIEDFINAVGKDRYVNRNRIKSRHIDFLICDSNVKVKLAIELDDYTHNTREAAELDEFKNQLMKEVGIRLFRVKVKDDYTDDLKRIVKFLV